MCGVFEELAVQYQHAAVIDFKAEVIRAPSFLPFGNCGRSRNLADVVVATNADEGHVLA